MSTLVELVRATASHLWPLGGDLSIEDEEEGTWAGVERSWAVAGAVTGLMRLGGDLSREDEESMFKERSCWPMVGTVAMEGLIVRCLDDRSLGGGGGGGSSSEED